MNSSTESFSHAVIDATAAETFSRHREMIYRVCLRLLRHHHDAEDVTQETFRRATSALDRWDSDRPIEPWLVSIASNRCKSLLVKQKRERKFTTLDENAGMLCDDSQGRVDDRTVLNEQIEDALDRLPARHRNAFELIHRHDRTYPEAAVEMGRSVGTIKTWVHRARKAMQESIRSNESSTQPLALPQPSTNWSTVAKRGTAASVASLLGFVCWFAVAPSSVSMVAEKPDASVRYQAESLQLFAQHTWTIEKIDQLPVSDWVTETSCVLEHLREGVAPLERTVSDIAWLFASATAAPDASLVQPKAVEETVPMKKTASSVPTNLELSLRADIKSIS